MVLRHSGSPSALPAPQGAPLTRTPGAVPELNRRAVFCLHLARVVALQDDPDRRVFAPGRVRVTLRYFELRCIVVRGPGTA